MGTSMPKPKDPPAAKPVPPLTAEQSRQQLKRLVASIGMYATNFNRDIRNKNELLTSTLARYKATIPNDVKQVEQLKLEAIMSRVAKALSELDDATQPYSRP